MSDNGWDRSARAWLDEQGEHGDWARRHVLDRVMMERVRAANPKTALDVGCGEGRFCRMLIAEGIEASGVEPTRALREAAIARGPAGIYYDGVAENLAFQDNLFDLVISYLTLIDIDEYEDAIREMARVAVPGGRILVANLASFNTANQLQGWTDTDKGRLFPIDRYLDARLEDVSWRDMAIRNWHRPLRDYMSAFIDAGLRLSYFDEPAPDGYPPQDEAKADRYRRVPYFVVMEWIKEGETNVP